VVFEKLNGAFGTRDMAGKAARVAVERSREAAEIQTLIPRNVDARYGVAGGLQEAGCFRQYPARSSSCAGREFTMNEQVINLIVKKTGITQENAQKSVLVVFDFLKTKLPAPITSQLEPFLTEGVLAGKS
jgi:hypothetical protein